MVHMQVKEDNTILLRCSVVFLNCLIVYKNDEKEKFGKNYDRKIICYTI